MFLLTFNNAYGSSDDDVEEKNVVIIVNSSAEPAVIDVAQMQSDLSDWNDCFWQDKFPNGII